MLTLNQLQSWGADTDAAMKRCMNNEAFYLRMVEKALRDPSFDQLKEAVASGDMDRGFEFAHGLKGVMGNLGLDPILRPVSEITELLRSHTDTDYSGLLEKIMTEREAIVRLL